MNELTYKLLIDKSVKRKVYILYLLLESSKPISFLELETLCNVSKKTIQQDTSLLLQELPNHLRLTTLNTKEALEIFGDLTAIKSFMETLIEGNPLFIVIQNIFDGKKLNLLDASEQLFITETTLRKYLSVLKTVLAEYNLILVMTPLDIIGNEVDIRYFYFHYFSNIHKSGQLNFPLEFDRFLNDNLMTFMKNKPNMNLDYHQLIHWFVITNERRKQKKYVTLDASIAAKYEKNNGYQNIKKIYEKIYRSTKPNFMEELNQQEFLYSYILMFSCVFYDSDSGGYFFTDDSYVLLKDFEELVHTYFIQSNLIFCLNMEFNFTIKAFLTNLKLLEDLSPLFQKVSSQSKKTTEKKYPDILKNWFQLLNEQTHFEYPYDIAVSLTLLTAAKAYKHKRILFCFSGESSSLSYLKTRALGTVPKEMDVQFHFNHTLDDTLLEKREIDICVVNFEPLNELRFSQLIRLSDFPLEREWTKLLLLLHNMAE